MGESYCLNYKNYFYKLKANLKISLNSAVKETFDSYDLLELLKNFKINATY